MIRQQIKRAGKLYAWGDAIHSILGTGNHDISLVPVKVSDLDVVHFHTGPQATMFITEQNELYGFGVNEYGNIIGKEKEYISPTKICDNIIDVACGDNFTIALNKNRQLLSWGSPAATGWRAWFGSKYSALGYPSDEIIRTPTLVPSVKDIQFAKIAAGSAHAVGLTTDGKVYTWGSNEYAACGNSDVYAQVTTPKIIDVISDIDFMDIDAARDSSCAVTEDGKLFVWGRNEMGQLGIITEETDWKNRFVIEAFPVQVPTEEKVMTISMGSHAMIAVTQTQEILVCGLSIWEKLSRFAAPVRAECVFCGEDYFAALGQDGQVYYFGGPFEGIDNKMQDYPNELHVTDKNFWPGRPIQVQGRYTYMMATLLEPEDD